MVAIAEKTEQRPHTLEAFLAWEGEAGYKYEWNDGELIKFEKMNKKHLMLIRKLQQIFFRTFAFANGGAFIMEQDVKLTGIQMRRPDLAYFSGEQIDASSTSDTDPIPAFVIEIISPSDDAEKIEEKLVEYFKAGVQVVWHAYLENQVVYVYNGRKNVVICTENDICSAAPVMPDFEISVKEWLIEA